MFKLPTSGTFSPPQLCLISSGAMIEAGSETTSAMLNNAIIGLLSNPSAIDAAHEELDRVIGDDRTPNFDDEKDLPYMRAIIKVHSPVF